MTTFLSLICIVFILSCSKTTNKYGHTYEIEKIDGTEWVALDSCVVTDTLIINELNNTIIPYLKTINASPRYNFLTVQIVNNNFLQISCKRKRYFQISKETISSYRNIGFSEFQNFFILLLTDISSYIKFTDDYNWIRYTRYSSKDDLQVINEALMYWQYYIYPESLSFRSEFCPPAENRYDDTKRYEDRQDLDTLEIIKGRFMAHQ